MSTLKPRTATIPIYQGDDAERLAELRMAVAIAERQAAQAEGAPRRMGDDPGADVQTARDAYDAFVDEAADRAVLVQVRSIGRKRFRDLVAAHPPRKEKNADGEDVIHDDDAGFDVNTETFPDALLNFMEAGEGGVRTIIEPDLSPSNLRSFLDDDITEGDFEKVWQTTYWLNRQPGSDPKALRYSPSTVETSE